MFITYALFYLQDSLVRVSRRDFDSFPLLHGQLSLQAFLVVNRDFTSSYLQKQKAWMFRYSVKAY